MLGKKKSKLEQSVSAHLLSKLFILSQHFNKAGYKTIALHGKSERDTRLHARKRLESGELDVIFTVDLFNEGVDIPSVDTLLFARPTESLTVFTQQIGRGLRLADGKSHCVIIDLIGNYRNADVKMRVFTEDGEQPKSLNAAALNLPETCDFRLDLAVVNLLEEMKRKRSPRKQQLVDAFLKLKTDLGVRPTYLDFHLKADADSRSIKQEFGSYPGLLAYAGELSDIELDAFERYKKWIQEATGTGMTKSYKMIVLHYMLSRGQDNWLNPSHTRANRTVFPSLLYGKRLSNTIQISLINKGKNFVHIMRRKSLPFSLACPCPIGVVRQKG